MGAQPRCLLSKLDAICATVGQLTTAVEELFAEHEQAVIIVSFPGAGALTGARPLAEIGDDATRFSAPRTPQRRSWPHTRGDPISASRGQMDVDDAVRQPGVVQQSI